MRIGVAQRKADAYFPTLSWMWGLSDTVHGHLSCYKT